MYKFYRASPRAFDKKPNESDLLCRFRHGPEISFKSGWNYEDLRIETLDGVVIDEYRQQPSDLWPLVIRPMLGAKLGWADILSTANGFDHFYDLFDMAKDHPEEWGWFHAPSTIAPWWTPEEIASARATMSEDEFAQEILAEFREVGKGKVYKNHGIHNQLMENPFSVRGLSWSPYLPLVIGLDFNVGTMAWEIGQHRNGDFYYSDEIAVENTNTQEVTPLLIEKVKGHKLGVILIGDASGKSQKTSASGSTDYSILMKAFKEAGIPCRNLTPEANPAVKDRVNMMNSRLKSADGSVHFWYHPKKCKRLKTDLERVTWKEGAQGAILDKSNVSLTHASDSAGYPVCYYSHEWRAAPGVLRVIER